MWKPDKTDITIKTRTRVTFSKIKNIYSNTKHYDITTLLTNLPHRH